MAYFTYVLLSERTGRRYTGSCEDVDERLRRHNAGHSPSTRHGVPWKIVHCESFETRTDAVQRERFLKSGKGRAVLDRLLS
jgi:putative endonuclease